MTPVPLATPLRRPVASRLCRPVVAWTRLLRRALRPRGAARRPWVAASLVGLVALLYFSTSDPILRGLLFPAGSVIVAISLVVGVIANRAEPRRAWATIAAGIVVVSAGLIVSSASSAHRLSADATLAGEALYAVGLLVVGAGVAVFVRDLVNDGSSVGILDGAVVSIGFGLALWLLVYDPLLVAPGVSLVDVGLLLGHPVPAGVLFAFLVGLSFAPGRKTPSLWLMVLAMACLCGSDLARLAAQRREGLALQAGDLLWFLAAACGAAAVLHSSVRRPLQLASGQTSHLSSLRMALLVLAMLVAPVALLVGDVSGSDGHEHRFIVLVGVVSSLLVVLRTAVTMRALRENLRDRTEAERGLRIQALHDGLTHLPNRVSFAQRLDVALMDDPSSVAVLFCDLDDFKAVNDTLGHAAGDELLTIVAGRLQRVVRPGDLVARLGGDEFAVLLADVRERAAAEQVASRVLSILRQPIEIAGRSIAPRASVGIAHGTRGALDALELMRDADIAMYAAKGSGKGRARAFEPHMRDDLLRRLRLRSDLERAIERGELGLAYQPLVDLRSGELHSIEGLVRWEHPELGPLQPAEFVPLAEMSGQIADLGRWVLGEACRQSAEWSRSGLMRRGIPVTVNVSAHQLHHPDFVEHVRGAMRAAGTARGELTLEVTESALADLPIAGPRLQALRELGARISVDDFGTGYSSLSYLGRLPIDNLKIDRALVAALGREDADAAIAEMVIMLAKRLGVEVVAEGIETEAQSLTLLRQGCHFGQGYLFARPMDGTAMRGYLRARHVGRGVLGPEAGSGRQGVRAANLAPAS